MNTAKSLRSFRRTFEQAFRVRQVGTTPATARVLRGPAIHRQIPSAITARRHQSTDAEPSYTPLPLTDRAADASKDSADADSIAMRKALSPAYQLWFTCKKCLERSGHTVSKQAYYFGTCVINCPKCKCQHLISDHLKIFTDRTMTMEEIAKEHGEKLRKGRLGADGDIEFYDEEATAKVNAD